MGRHKTGEKPLPSEQRWGGERERLTSPVIQFSSPSFSPASPRKSHHLTLLFLLNFSSPSPFFTFSPFLVLLPNMSQENSSPHPAFLTSFLLPSFCLASLPFPRHSPHHVLPPFSSPAPFFNFSPFLTILPSMSKETSSPYLAFFTSFFSSPAPFFTYFPFFGILPTALLPISVLRVIVSPLFHSSPMFYSPSLSYRASLSSAGSSFFRFPFSHPSFSSPSPFSHLLPFLFLSYPFPPLSHLFIFLRFPFLP